MNCNMPGSQLAEPHLSHVFTSRLSKCTCGHHVPISVTCCESCDYFKVITFKADCGPQNGSVLATLMIQTKGYKLR